MCVQNIYNSNLKLFSCAGSQADQVCYLSYPHVKRPRKIWLPVLKVNPRQAVEGKFVVLLQTDDDEGPSDTIEEIIVDNLADRNHPAGKLISKSEMLIQKTNFIVTYHLQMMIIMKTLNNVIETNV